MSTNDDKRVTDGRYTDERRTTDDRYVDDDHHLGKHAAGTTGTGAVADDRAEAERREAAAGSTTVEERDRLAEEHARKRFGGINWGACFFGWLVAIALSILLTSIIGAILAGIGSNASITQSDAQRQAGTIGIAAAITLLVVLAIGYYAGGYVAGRMSRFDGAKQGGGTWLIGLVVTLIAIALGAAFGSQYNLLDRVSLPRIPIDTTHLGWGALITAVAVIVVTLLAALLGGVVGHRYHNRVDRAIRR